MSHSDEAPSSRRIAALTLGALGVVYGDIGTSPLYAVKESFNPHHHLNSSDPQNVIGVISLIVYSLTILICIKYLTFVLRADMHGEGGAITLTGLVAQSRAQKSKFFPLLMTLGLLGTALLYGDGMITPAISVLGALEGISVSTKVFDPYIVPITLAILVVLFVAQSHGTEKVGRVFGPVMLVWFFAIAVFGVMEAMKSPAILAALSPLPGIRFLMEHGLGSVGVLGSVVLVVTGGEALYADMGHFGRTPIRFAWFCMVFPCLILNYLGQGAIILRDPTSVDNPFFRIVPPAILPFMVLLATMAAIIASQAMISGAFSLTLQAMQFGYIPRLRVDHTSDMQKGQIYIPAVNWILMIACIGLVLGFRASSNLAAAYGIAVTGTFVITTTLFFFLLKDAWNWHPLKAFLLCASFGILDVSFFLSNVIKIPDGGWFPLVMAGLIFTVMSTWKKGRGVVAQVLASQTVPLHSLLATLGPPTEGEPEPSPILPHGEKTVRVPGTAVFMYGNRKGTPPALLSNLRHNKVIHERVIVVAVEISDRAFEPRYLEVTPLGHGFFRVVLRFGYMDQPDVPAALMSGKTEDGQPLVNEKTSYFLGKETLIPRAHKFSGMAFWRERLFAILSKNARDATAFFNLPPANVVELGTQVEI